MNKFELMEKFSAEGKSIKAALIEQFPGLTDDDFGTYESDLYVRNYPGIAKFVRSKGITFSHFISQIDKKSWLDLSFQNEAFWIEKCGSR